MITEKFANFHGYSDVTPYEIVRVISDKTIEVREMDSKLLDDWKPEFVKGGFVAHCTNNNSQAYSYNSNLTNKIIRVRLRKDGKWYSKYGKHVLSTKPIAFYDYNF